MTRQMKLEHCIKDRRPKQRAPIGLKNKGSFVLKKGEEEKHIILENAINSKLKAEKQAYEI